MSEEQCKAFVVQSVSHAMARDGSSGGNIRTVVINSSGVKKDFLERDQGGRPYFQFRDRQLVFPLTQHDIL